MKTYRGIIRDNTVVLDHNPGVQDGTKVTIIIQPAEDTERKIIRRQKAMLNESFEMVISSIPTAESFIIVENCLFDLKLPGRNQSNSHKKAPKAQN